MSNNYTFTAKQVIDKKVKNFSDKDLGKIEDVAINPTGVVEYAILSANGIFGTTLNDKEFAVPYKTLIWDNEENCLRIDVSEDFIENAPGFDQDNRPDFADDRFKEEVSKYYTNVKSYEAGEI
jgi:sporulation protein YlmC with PRC-barrel domain